MLLTFLFAYLIEKSKPMPLVRSICRFFAMMPMALPGMVIGLAYVMFFNKTGFTIPLIGAGYSESVPFIVSDFGDYGNFQYCTYVFRNIYYGDNRIEKTGFGI